MWNRIPLNDSRNSGNGFFFLEFSNPSHVQEKFLEKHRPLDSLNRSWKNFDRLTQNAAHDPWDMAPDQKLLRAIKVEFSNAIKWEIMS